MAAIRASEIDQKIKMARAGCQSADYRMESARGLWLRISALGVASWSLVYRTKGDPTLTLRRYKLGRYPEIGAAAASERARALMGQIEGGYDPQRAVRDKATLDVDGGSEPISVGQAADAFLAAKSDRRSIKNMRQMLVSNLVARHGTLPITALTRDHVIDIHDAIAQTNRLRAADNTFSTIRSFLSYCHKERQWVSTNVASGISLKQKAGQGRRDRTLTADEMRILWRLLHQDAGLSWAMRGIIKLALLLGQRVGEIAGMHRSEVDVEANGIGMVWIIPASRMKAGRPQVLRLPPLCREIVSEALQRTSGPVLFHSRGGQAFRSSVIAHAMARIQRPTDFRTKDGKPNPVKMHDLRRTVATGLQHIGVNNDTVKLVLAHAPLGVTEQVYAKSDRCREVHAALTRWQLTIMQIIDDNADPFSFHSEDALAIEERILGERSRPAMARSIL